MRRVSLLLLSTLILSSCTATTIDVAEPEATEAAATPTKTEGEQLLAEPPSGWSLAYQLSNESTRFADFVPSGQSSTEWTDKISFESFVAEDPNLDPISLLESEAEQDQNKCNFVQHFNIFSGLENNYETSVRLFMCGENQFAHKGEIKLVKAIRGNDNFYTIKIIRRVDPFDVHQPEFANEEMAEWSAFMRKVKVCDTTRPDHACPTQSE